MLCVFVCNFGGDFIGSLFVWGLVATVFFCGLLPCLFVDFGIVLILIVFLWGS